jgi:hypothetical protein
MIAAVTPSVLVGPCSGARRSAGVAIGSGRRIPAVRRTARAASDQGVMLRHAHAALSGLHLGRSRTLAARAPRPREGEPPALGERPAAARSVP